MSTGFHVVWDDHHTRVQLVASATEPGFPVSNLETGNLGRWWLGVGTGEHTLTRDFGANATAALDTVVVANALRLVNVGASLALQRSDNGSSWTDVWAVAPLTAAHLAPPNGRDFIQESPLDTRRAWRLRIYGSLTGPPRLSGGLFMGVRTKLPTSPILGRTHGVERPYRGRDLTCSWPPMARVDARAIKAAHAAVTPSAAEGFHETVEGVGYGGRQFWLWDPDGRTFSEATPFGPPFGPWLVPVLCTTPDAASSTSRTPGLDDGPISIGYRELR